MLIFQKTNLLPPKLYLRAMILANGVLLAAWICYLIFEKQILSPLAALAIFISIVICYFIGLYKHPQMYQAMKSNVWWWEYPLFFVGLIFTATRESATVFILLWAFLFENGVLLLKYSTAKR